ncbi:MAG: hypothetical protein ABL857_02560 [Rickettsiales bacterium]|jgi:hypothetical protein
MDTILTFIIPVRHQENSKNWQELKQNLTDTIRSISAQKNKNWRAVIVANHGAELPELPEQFEVKRVGFEPNRLHEQGNADKEAFYESFRIDKGRRVLAGMLHARETQYFMIVDDDDFVSNKLTGFVAENASANGWYIQNGYIWAHGSKILYLYSNFASFCGTSLIIRSDLYQLPASFEEATEEYIKKMLGSHVFIKGHLESQKTPLAPLSFTGAVYRVGHSGAHSQSKSSTIFCFFKNREVIKKPLEFTKRIFRLRLLTDSIKKEFFGKI